MRTHTNSAATVDDSTVTAAAAAPAFSDGLDRQGGGSPLSANERNANSRNNENHRLHRRHLTNAGRYNTIIDLLAEVICKVDHVERRVVKVKSTNEARYDTIIDLLTEIIDKLDSAEEREANVERSATDASHAAVQADNRIKATTTTTATQGFRKSAASAAIDAEYMMDEDL